MWNEGSENRRNLRARLGVKGSKWCVYSSFQWHVSVCLKERKVYTACIRVFVCVLYITHAYIDVDVVEVNGCVTSLRTRQHRPKPNPIAPVWRLWWFRMDGAFSIHYHRRRILHKYILYTKDVIEFPSGYGSDIIYIHTRIKTFIHTTRVISFLLHFSCKVYLTKTPY